MIILSKTFTNGRVIELTAEEWREFANLARSLEGKTEGESRWEFTMRSENIVLSEVDYSGVFGAILAFAEANFRVTEFKNLIGRIDRFLEVKK